MQDMDFWFFWDIFRKKWRMIVLVAFLVALGVGMVSKLFIKPVYRSSVSLYFGRVTETSPLEKLAAVGSASALGETAAQLNIATSLSSDYRELINLDVIKDGVADELAKQGKWEKKKYKTSAEQEKMARTMRINIDSDDPLFSQEVANIYANQFINKVQQLVGIQNTQIMQEPELNLKPISPNIPRNILMGFLGGFILCFMSYVGFRTIDRTLKTSREVEDSLNVPVVGTVHKDTDFTLDKNNPLLFSKGENTEKARTQIAEDFRVFRVNLINRKPQDKKDGSVIAVTSAQAKEGKTFCTANLGAALAEAGYKVLLMDCDTGKRGLQSYFGTTDEKGLMNILSDETDFDHAVKHNLNNMNMDVLFCGNKDVNSANLMISPKFKNLVESVKQKYDYAFLDVSCHLGTADIVSAGSTADSVLLLVRAGKTEGETAKQTIETLKRANLDVTGVILNGVEE